MRIRDWVQKLENFVDSIYTWPLMYCTVMYIILICTLSVLSLYFSLLGLLLLFTLH